jgi:hypothetical protein
MSGAPETEVNETEQQRVERIRAEERKRHAEQTLPSFAWPLPAPEYDWKRKRHD